MQNTLTSQNTNELVKKCGQGDPESLRRFFEIFSIDIYNFPLKVFHLSEDDAGDFYLYAFEKLKDGKRLKNFEGKSQFRTWFYSVLRNLLIDWKRRKKEVLIQSSVKTNQEGMEYGGIEEEPDLLTENKKIAGEFSKEFRVALREIKLENRVIFKLAYIYYLHLEEDEIEYILDKSGYSLDQLKEWILAIRENLSSREMDIQKMEDKITSLYLNILDLKKLKKEEDSTSESKSNLPDIDRIGKALEKKYEQRRKLLEKRQKGHFLARTPFKEVSNLLGISEGGASVSVIRTTEILQKKLNLDEYS